MRGSRHPGYWALALLLLSCRGSSPSLEEFVREKRPVYRAAVARAESWLKGVSVDPVDLNRRHVLGKKKLGEKLAAYRSLWKGDDTIRRERIRKEVGVLAAQTLRPEYHDLRKVPDTLFRQESMSYLRSAYLLDRSGFDTGTYRAEIHKLQPRLDAHLKTRGPYQTEVFRRYYGHFGLAGPFASAGALRNGTLAKRLPVGHIGPTETYLITHEVFASTLYGETAPEGISEEDRAYLRVTLPALLQKSMDAGDADTSAQLISCLWSLGWKSEPAVREGVEYLLSSQQPDGSWRCPGDRASLSAELGRLLDLHTVAVALGALVPVFEGGSG